MQVLKEKVKDTRESAIKAPGRMVARYDSSKEELSYLHDGLAKMFLEKQQNLSKIIEIKVEKKNKIETGALFVTEKENYFFILPCEGGRTIKYTLPTGNPIMINTITMNTPLLQKSINHKKKQAQKEGDREIYLEEGDFIIWPNDTKEKIIKIV